MNRIETNRPIESIESLLLMFTSKGGVHFDQIHDVYVDHSRIKTSDQKTRQVFVVGASCRHFVLSTFCPELMRIWVDVIFTGAQAYQDFEET